jgi:hypothetical protein
MFGLSSNSVTFPKACMSDMADISALLGSISGIANLQVSFREGLPPD